VAIVIVFIHFTPTLRASIRPSSRVSQVFQRTANLKSFASQVLQRKTNLGFTCLLGLCKAENLASPLNEPHDLTVWSGGAYAVEDFTSPTFSDKGKSWWNWWAQDTATVRWAGPIAVLDPAISCWSFEGASGFITLQLIDNATISSVQIAHADETHLQKFAPKDFIIWALVDSDSFSVKEIPHHTTPPPNLERLVSNRFYPIRLGAFSFEVASHAAGQRFAVDAGVLESYGGRVDKVMFHVLSNWGAKRTCLYHLRVFGGL
jgi:hypothetical protein